MNDIIDIHCHLLPGVDDGPETLEDSLALLREAQRQGVGRMIATPHYHPGRYIVDSRETYRKIDLIRKACEEHGIEIQIYPGQECYWYSELAESLEKGLALTMNRTRFVLVEFEPDTIFSVMQNAVRSLAYNGYYVIIAHFERYECLYGRSDRLDLLKNEGAYLQLNFDRLLDKDSIFHRNPWRRMVQEEIVDFLGSDTHGMNFRPPRMKKAVEWLEEHVDEHIVWKLMVSNPAMIVSDN